MNSRRIVEAAQLLLPKATEGTVVLAYHLVGAGTASPVDIDPKEFRRQLDVICSRCEVRSFDVMLSTKPRSQARTPVVVLTFDDAYLNFRQVAWPALAERGLPVMLYVPVGFVNGSIAPIRGTTLPACTWSDLRTLASEGVSI